MCSTYSWFGRASLFTEINFDVALPSDGSPASFGFHAPVFFEGVMTRHAVVLRGRSDMCRCRSSSNAECFTTPCPAMGALLNASGWQNPLAASEPSICRTRICKSALFPMSKSSLRSSCKCCCCYTSRYSDRSFVHNLVVARLVKHSIIASSIQMIKCILEIIIEDLGANKLTVTES
jgi:hypothetical protein